MEKSQLLAKLNEMQKAIAGYKESKERAKSPQIGYQVQRLSETMVENESGGHPHQMIH